MDSSIWQDYQGIYVHLPFCRQKCIYCDFASYAGLGEAKMREYVAALCHEICVRAQSEREHLAPNASIYFGGGTPSVLPIDSLTRIVCTLKEGGLWQQPREATIEVNPGTADAEKLLALRALGFDRISFGVQSLQDAELRTIGRIHTAAQALAAVRMARAAGFARISCDLIYGLPGQTLASLEATLTQLAAAGIDHLSVYGLIVEAGTVLERLLDEGKLTLPDEDLCADMYEAVQRFTAQHGLARYEISNYARPGQESLHNITYWCYHPYLAFGAAACGFDGRCRRTALIGVEEYISAARRLTQADWQRSELYEVEKLSGAQQLEEFMFMGMRRTRGANLAEARARFGVDVRARFGQELRPFEEANLVRYAESGDRLLLTEAGMEVGNRIFEIFVGDTE